MIDCGNVTGFNAFEYDIGGKWLSLLKQFAPGIACVALLYNSNTAPWTDNFRRSFQATAPSFGVTPVQMNVRDAPAIEHAIEALAREPNGASLACRGNGDDACKLLRARICDPVRGDDAARLTKPGLIHQAAVLSL